MKRFAVILIIAVLALGCVFAATGDSQKTDGQNVTSGDKVIVTTDINVIYPVYMITASNGADTEDSASTAKEITARKVYDGTTHELTKVQIDVALKHFGYLENDTEKAKTYIRYAKNVKVYIVAKELKNTTTADGHVASSSIPRIVTPTTIPTSDDFAASATDVDNKLTVEAQYKTGKRVGNETFNQQIASCTFEWDVLELTAGDTYKADIIVTYENV